MPYFGTLVARALYAYVNQGIEDEAVDARTLSLYVNHGIEDDAVDARTLSLYVNQGIEDEAVDARTLYGYVSPRDGEPSPWLMKLDPTEQYRGGTVDLYGDGFGEVRDCSAEATATASSTNGANLPAYACNVAGDEWVSNDGATAWLRLTFPGPRTLVGVALEDRDAVNQDWGVPLFRFSDGGADVVGGSAVPAPEVTSPEYPVGALRTYYAFAARTVTWIEIRVSSGGAGSNRGLREVWVYADEDQAAESSSAILNAGLLSEEALGIVSWSNRSPGLWPANGGLPITLAATVTLPDDAVSGLVDVEETT